jgi:hypothetical protein
MNQLYIDVALSQYLNVSWTFISSAWDKITNSHGPVWGRYNISCGGIDETVLVWFKYNLCDWEGPRKLKGQAIRPWNSRNVQRWIQVTTNTNLPWTKAGEHDLILFLFFI